MNPVTTSRIPGNLKPCRSLTNPCSKPVNALEPDVTWCKPWRNLARTVSGTELRTLLFLYFFFVFVSLSLSLPLSLSLSLCLPLPPVLSSFDLSLSSSLFVYIHINTSIFLPCVKLYPPQSNFAESEWVPISLEGRGGCCGLERQGRESGAHAYVSQGFYLGFGQCNYVGLVI